MHDDPNKDASNQLSVYENVQLKLLPWITRTNIFLRKLLGDGTEIRNHYMSRFYLTPKSWCDKFGGLMYHIFHTGDDSQPPHTHPFWFAALIVKGGYWERVLIGSTHDRGGLSMQTAEDLVEGYRHWWRGPGSIVIRSPKDAHEVMLQPGGKAVHSIVIRGPYVSAWGFVVDGITVPWDEFMLHAGNISGGARLVHPTHRFSISKDVGSPDERIACGGCGIDPITSPSAALNPCANSNQREFWYHIDHPPISAFKRLMMKVTGYRGGYDGTYRFTWAEISFGWGLALSYIATHASDDPPRAMLHVHLLYLNIFFSLPAWLPAPNVNEYTTYGISWRWHSLNDMHIHINLPAWAPRRVIILNMPWQRKILLNEYLRKDLTWEYAPIYSESNNPRNPKPHAYVEEHTYPWVSRWSLKGITPELTPCSVTVSRTTSSPLCLSRWPRFHTCETYLNIHFKDEVGSGRGSYKGGTVGASFKMKDCESISRALRRMSEEEVIR